MERDRRRDRAQDPSRQEKMALLESIALRRAQKGLSSTVVTASSIPLPDSDDGGLETEPEKESVRVRGKVLGAGQTVRKLQPSVTDLPNDSSPEREELPLANVLNSLGSLSLRTTGRTSTSGALQEQRTNYVAGKPHINAPHLQGQLHRNKGGNQSLSSKASRDLVELSSDDEDDDFQPTVRKAKGQDQGVMTSGSSSSLKISESQQKLIPREVSKDRDGSDMILGEGRKSYCLAGKVARKLYTHQVEGIRWLWGLHNKKMGGILGDDMGLGKTMQIAAFLAGLVSSKLIRTAMVVAPKTLLPHWARELATVGLSRKTYNYAETSTRAREDALRGVLKHGGVLLTTYDMVRCNWKVLQGDVSGREDFQDQSDGSSTWDYLILDEGHLIKNPSTERAKSLREIPSSHRIIISGTPIQNHLREMWALFDFCCPNLLGDKAEFKAKYELKILASQDKCSSDRAKRLGAAAAEELRKQIAPFFLRRLKSEVFPEEAESSDAPKLSRKNDLIVWLRLSPRQEKLYRAFLESEAVSNALDGSSALTALSVMKKICDHPSLLTKRAADDIAEGLEGMMGASDPVDAEAMTAALAGLVEEDLGFSESKGAVSCKIDFLLVLMEKLVEEGHRTLIFSQTRKVLDIIQGEIEQRRWRYRRIDGSMKSCDRETQVNEFQTDSRIPLFLLTSKVGGLGLTLTAADRVVIVDPAWNPSTDNQSVDRAYRIGQKKDVIVYRLMTCGTIEEKIYRKQVFKGGLMKTATEAKNQMRYFSQQELQDLFRVPTTGFDVSVTQKQMHEEHFGEHRTNADLEEHIRYLEGLSMISGVSHHDLLYSKAAPELPPPPAGEDDAEVSWEPRNTAQPRRPSKPASKEPDYAWESANDSGAEIRIPPPPPDAFDEAKHAWLRASFLKDKIKRLAVILENEDTVAKLSDGGVKIMRKIKELSAEVAKLELSEANYKENLTTQADGVGRVDGKYPDGTVIGKSSQAPRPAQTGGNGSTVSSQPGEPLVRVRSASGNNIYHGSGNINAGGSGSTELHHARGHADIKSSDSRIETLEETFANFRVM